VGWRCIQTHGRWCRCGRRTMDDFRRRAGRDRSRFAEPTQTRTSSSPESRSAGGWPNGGRTCWTSWPTFPSEDASGLIAKRKPLPSSCRSPDRNVVAGTSAIMRSAGQAAASDAQRGRFYSSPPPRARGCADASGGREYRIWHQQMTFYLRARPDPGGTSYPQ
jgi:hypothetical protein